jgi:hypothetical protein
MAWDRTIGDTGQDIFSHVDMDADGNVFVAGSFSGQVSVDAEHFDETDGSGLVISYTPGGGVRWVRQLSGGPSDLVVTSTGAVVISGSGADLVRLEGSSGATVWSVGEPRALYGTKLAATHDDGVVIVGHGNQADEAFAGLTFTGEGDYAIVKIDAAGDGIWRREYGAEQTGDALIVFQDADATASLVVVGGYYQDRVDLGDGASRQTNGWNDYFAIGFAASDGALSWVHAHPNSDYTSFASASSVSIDADRVLVAGWYGPSIRITDTVTRTVESGGELFVITLSTVGEYDSDLTTGSSESAAVRGVALESTGNLVMVGDFQGQIDLGTGFQPSSREGMGLSGFLVVLGPDGSHVTDRVFSSSVDPAAMVTCGAVAVGPANSTALVGHFTGTAMFAGGPKISQGGVDAFVYRLAR